MKKIICSLFIIAELVNPIFSFSEMSSEHYQILGDQVGIGAGESSGGVYTLKDSSGALITAGIIDSNAYEIRSGFYFMDSGVLSLDISPSSLSLGALSASTVKTAETSITVSTDSATGYTLAIDSVSAGGLTNVSDGTVTAGSEEFGFSGSGADCLLSPTTDTSTTAGLPIASHSTAISFSTTTLTFKAAISNSTASTASGAKTISFIVSANF